MSSSVRRVENVGFFMSTGRCNRISASLFESMKKQLKYNSRMQRNTNDKYLKTFTNHLHSALWHIYSSLFDLSKRLIPKTNTVIYESKLVNAHRDHDLKEQFPAFHPFVFGGIHFQDADQHEQNPY